MERDVGMAVPKTTKTRCRDGILHAMRAYKGYTIKPHPYIVFFFCMMLFH